MKKNLNDVLINSYDRDKNQLIVLYDDMNNVKKFTFSNIPDKVKHMKIERYIVVGEKLFIIKVVGVINE